MFERVLNTLLVDSHFCRSGPLRYIFLKTGIRKNFLQLYYKETATQVFFCKICEIL